MLKGVNRQVVEVSQPESGYFERVLFFVKPEFYGLGEAKLRSKADALIKDTSEPPSTKHKKRKKGKGEAVKIFLSASAGAVAAAIISAIF
ncbi:MAG: hypothetical protein IJE93_05800 [Clostridia bacterium]|nr:hypothetical protein [Clostridia bacterium]